MKLPRPLRQSRTATAPLVLVGLGLLLSVLALAADRLGLGWRPGIGRQQVAFSLLGTAVALGGCVLAVSEAARDRLRCAWRRVSAIVQPGSREREVWLLAFACSILFTGLVLLLLNRRYDMVDDVGLRDYARAGLAQKFSAYWYGQILSFLYQSLSGVIPWYSISIYLIDVTILAVCLFLVFVKATPAVYRAAFASLLLAMYTLLIMCLSWNMTSMLAGGVAIVALFEAIRANRPRPVLRAALLGILLAASYSVRLESPRVSAVYVGPPLLAMLLILLLTRQVSLRRLVLRVASFLLPLAAVMSYGHYQEAHSYSLEMRLWREWHSIQSDFYDYGLEAELKRATRLLRANAWTGNDIEIYSSALAFLNEYKFSAERLLRIRDRESGIASRDLHKDQLDNLLHFGQLPGFAWNLIRVGIPPAPFWVYMLAVAAVGLFALLEGSQLHHRLFGLLMSGYIYLVLIYVQNYFWTRYYLVIAALILTVIATFCAVEIDGARIHLRRLRCFDSGSAPPDPAIGPLPAPGRRRKAGWQAWTARLHAIAVALLFAVSIAALLRSVLQLNLDIAERREKFFVTYSALARRLGNDAFFLIRPRFWLEHHMDPLALGDQGPVTHNSAVGLATAAWSPTLYKTLREEYGLDYGYQILPWMVDNPRAYLLTTDTAILQQILTFMEETYGLTCRAEPAVSFSNDVGAYRLASVESQADHFHEIMNLIDGFDPAHTTAPDPGRIHESAFTLTGQSKDVLYQPPPSKVSYDLLVPPRAVLQFSTALSAQAWTVGAGKGDGVEFRVSVVDGQHEQVVFSDYIDPCNVPEDRRWHDHQVDLTQWEGQPITLVLETLPGPEQDTRWDQAAWVQPRIGQQTYYDLVQKFYLACPVPERLDYTLPRRIQVNATWRDAVFQHAPGWLEFPVHLKAASTLFFEIGLDPATWGPGHGDGVQFEVLVKTLEKTYQVYSSYVDPKNVPADRGWLQAAVDLSRFAEQDVAIVLITKPGPKGDDSFDWSYWIGPRLVENP